MNEISLSEKDFVSLVSNTFCISCTLRIIVFPVVHPACLDAVSFKDFLTIWVFFSSHLFKHLVLLLPFKGPCNLLLCQLFNRHGWEDVPRLENLVLILMLDVNALIDCLLLDI